MSPSNIVRPVSTRRRPRPCDDAPADAHRLAKPHRRTYTTSKTSADAGRNVGGGMLAPMSVLPPCHSGGVKGVSVDEETLSQPPTPPPPVRSESSTSTEAAEAIQSAAHGLPRTSHRSRVRNEPPSTSPAHTPTPPPREASARVSEMAQSRSVSEPPAATAPANGARSTARDLATTVPPSYAANPGPAMSRAVAHERQPTDTVTDGERRRLDLRAGDQHDGARAGFGGALAGAGDGHVVERRMPETTQSTIAARDSTRAATNVVTRGVCRASHLPTPPDVHSRRIERKS